MIVIETSALVAIAFNEPECAEFIAAIVGADTALVSAVSIVESRMVVHRRKGAEAVQALDELVAQTVFEIVPPGEAEIAAAHAAFIAYGKGSGHPAQLNFGDLFGYALAKTRGLPLLFKGDDFSQTDIESATKQLG
jgi:ribonuclease VapC